MSDTKGAVKTEAPVVADESVELARRYADAMIQAAQGEGDVEKLLAELEEIDRDVLAAHPQLALILASARVPTAQKDRILVELFENRASALAVKFLRVLNRRGRLGLLSAVVRQARALWDRRNNRVPVVVRTAVPLGSAQLEALRDRLARLTGASPILQITTDPDLIGGLVVQVGDHRYDASVKSRLASLRERLIQGKTHEIQSRRDQFSNPA
jgi:F-type H+-transporting ATPase subunit delta